MAGKQSDFRNGNLNETIKNLYAEYESQKEQAKQEGRDTSSLEDMLSLLNTLSYFSEHIPVAGPYIEKIITMITMTGKLSPAVLHFINTGFGGALRSELQKLSKRDGVRIGSATQMAVLTAVGLALSLPALPAIGAAVSAWASVIDVGGKYDEAERSTNPLYLAQKKLEEIEALAADTNPNHLHASIKKREILMAQVDALLHLATKNTPSSEMERIQAKFEAERAKVSTGYTLNAQEKTALAQFLIDEQKDIMQSCKRELPALLATAMVATAVAAIATLAMAAAAVGAVAAAPYVVPIIMIGLAVATLVIGAVKLAQVLDDKVYTHMAVNHAADVVKQHQPNPGSVDDAAAKKQAKEGLLAAAASKKGLRTEFLSKESRNKLIKDEARAQYTEYLEGKVVSKVFNPPRAR